MSTFIYIFIGLITGLAAALVVAFIFTKKNQANPDQLSEDFFNKFNQKFPEILNQANNNLITLANQKIGTDLQNKKDSIQEMVKQVLEEMKINATKLEQAEKNRVGSFESLRESLENNRKITEQLSTTAEGLKKVLSNNQTRGQFGEQIAEDLLKIAGFVPGVDYLKQSAGEESRPDFTLLLPDSTKINMDSKFPYANIVKMSEAEDRSQKDVFLRAFAQDIKTKVKEVSSRNYINPEDKTVDFVILFIPNEMIFSFIYENFPEIWQDAMAKKVILAGPFSFTAILRMVRQAYDNFRYQKNIQEIITQIKLFDREFEKYNEEFVKLGSKIDGLSRQYNEINTTRTNKLVRSIDKIKLESPSDDAANQKLIDL